MTIVLGAEAYRAPLSVAQQGVWFAAQLAPEPLYTIAFALVFEDGLDPRAAETALRHLIQRHHPLRTTFTVAGDEPVQVIRELNGATIEWTDAPNGDDAIAKRLRQQMDEPFVLSSDSQAPLRVSGLHLTGGGSALLVTVHHLCFDGTSVSLFTSEFYGYLAGTTRSPQTPTYAEVVRWQQDQLAAGGLDNSRDYWLERLSGWESVAASTSSAGATVELDLPPQISADLDGLARRNRTSRFTVLAAALLALLHRYSGQEDVAVGMPVSQHELLPETREMIGLLLNTVVLRQKVEPAVSFKALLGEVRGAVLDALEHGDYPVELLTRQLSKGRALFDVMLNYERSETLHRPASDPAPARLLGCEEREAKFPLTLYVIDGPVCTLRAAFQTARHTTEQMRMLLEQLVVLLRRVAANDEGPLDALSLLTESSVAVLADPAKSLPRNDTTNVVERFLGVVAAMPEAIAVTDGARGWTYAELEAETRIAAEGLVARGIGAGDVVAVTEPRGFGFIRAMLAVLRSGAVFQPIDPELPPARQRQLITDSGATVFADSPGAPGSVLPQGFEPDRPCYLFFTSGTTGKPKPVVGVHAGLAHFIGWEAGRFAVGPGDRVAQLTSAGFDPFLRDVLLPLTTGATLCLPPQGLRTGDAAVLGWLAAQRITVLHAVPSLAKWWLAAGEPVELPALRLTLFAGEPLTGVLVGQWRAIAASTEVVNLYGPTETTQAVCHYVLPQRVASGVQPIGRAIPGTQVLLLSPGGRRCAVGEVGEICVRSPYRSTGRDPGTQEMLSGFFKNPFRTADGEDLVYRSGDLGRMRADGTLEILGRRDHQIKVNGVRIDPNEIAATLAAHPAVADCVVHQWRDEDGPSLLAAYVVRSGQAVPTPRELRHWAGERLARAMVPSAVVVLDRMPVTANGKVDRRALPRPDVGAQAQGREASSPQEKRVCAILAELLRRPTVYADDDFFALGGDSLVMTQLVVRLEGEFGVRLGFDEVFRHPVLQDVAALLAQRQTATVARPTARANSEVRLTGLADDEMDVLLAALRGGARR
ncbi:MAG TPA: AMP-binding protein [Candidatus Limnocylindrales bacterium]|nr:AMP-binding protein [Candidatus Limnocylindrales bacterium]